ncbi:MAG: flagellar export chaperone FliS [Betaproteobacteria bacterium]|jgi:flagellar protein FliS
MFASPRSYADSYHRVHVESGAQSGDPHKLIEMLLQGAIDAVNKARGALERQDMRVKGEQVSKAVRIVEEGLRAALDRTAGGQIAVELDQLYAYVARRLTLANVRNDDAALMECVQLLLPIHDAWSGIRPAVGSGRPQ